MNDPSATATAEAPSGKHKSAAARGAGCGAKGRKQAAADGRPGAKKPAPAQRPKTDRPKPAAGGRAQSRPQPAEGGRTHPEAPRRKPTRRTKPNSAPPPSQQQATSPPEPAAPKPNGGPVEPAGPATPQAARVGPAATVTPHTPPPVQDQTVRLRGLVERANAGDGAAPRAVAFSRPLVPAVIDLQYAFLAAVSPYLERCGALEITRDLSRRRFVYFFVGSGGVASQIRIVPAAAPAARR